MKDLEKLKEQASYKWKVKTYITSWDVNSGEFMVGDELICSWNYDKKQDKYITKLLHSSYNKGYKFLYAKSPSGLRIQIEKRLNNAIP